MEKIKKGIEKNGKEGYNSITEYLKRRKSGNKSHSLLVGVIAILKEVAIFLKKWEDGNLASIEERVETFVSKPIENLGYQLYDVQYAKEGKDYFLRIFIEKENGIISLEDCEKVNNEIEEMLDMADYIKEQYFLEVSSAGVEKQIRKEKHLQENIDEMIVVKLFKPINNSKEYVGALKKFDDETIYLEVNNDIVELERKNISLIKKFYDWDLK